MARYIDADKIKWREEKDQIFGRDIVFAELWQVNEIPTADVAEVKHGEWEVVDEAEPRRYGCSRCKCLSWTADNYCSYCGAKMEMEQ